MSHQQTPRTLREAIERKRDRHLADAKLFEGLGDGYRYQRRLEEDEARKLTAALALPDAGEGKPSLPEPTFFIPKRVCEGAPIRDGICDRCGIENASKASINDPRCLSFTPPSPQPLTREELLEVASVMEGYAEDVPLGADEARVRALVAKCRAYAEPETGR